MIEILVLALGLVIGCLGGLTHNHRHAYKKGWNIGFAAGRHSKCGHGRRGGRT